MIMYIILYYTRKWPQKNDDFRLKYDFEIKALLPLAHTAPVSYQATWLN